MESTTSTNAVMCATVCQACPSHLLVCDHATHQQVVVHTDQACCFPAGSNIRICYNGAMTASIPPQISAQSIQRISCCR